MLRDLGKRTVVVRHPMPYGDLVAQRVQRFATIADLDAAEVTIEEREDYEPHVLAGNVVHTGVDYAAVLRATEAESDLVLWDGGNNDTPFFRPDLWITIVDPFRVGHELGYHPGEVNFRSADIVVINKADSAPPGSIEQLRANIAATNPSARVVVTKSVVSVDDPALIQGKRVLLIEDGPTLTHGGMPFGAGFVAAPTGRRGGDRRSPAARGRSDRRALSPLPPRRRRAALPSATRPKKSATSRRRSARPSATPSWSRRRPTSATCCASIDPRRGFATRSPTTARRRSRT